MDTVASVAVLGVLVFLVIAEGGANLDAPADPSSANYPARPEWYFLSLFQMLKYFPGEYEVIGTIVIPTAIMVVLLLLPLLDKVLPGRLAHFLACSFVFALVGGAGYLTVEAWRDGRREPEVPADRAEADAARRRAIELAGDEKVGIPPDGAAYVLLRDPLFHGRAVLERKCLGCHYYDGKGVGDAVGRRPEGLRLARLDPRPAGGPAVAGVLRQGPPVRRHGRVEEELQAVPRATRRRGRFRRHVRQDRPRDDPPGMARRPEGRRTSGAGTLRDGMRHVPYHRGAERGRGGDPRRAQALRLGFAAVDRPDDPQAGRPDLYGYLEKKDQMPAFADQLTENDTETLIRFLRNDYPGATFPSEAPPKTAVAKAAAR